MFVNRLGAPVLLTQSQGEAADCTARRSSGSGAAHATVPTTAMPSGGYRATAVTSDHHCSRSCLTAGAGGAAELQSAVQGQGGRLAGGEASGGDLFGGGANEPD